MIKRKDLRDISVAALALGTAYGLGILSCVYWEIKIFAECCKAVKEDSYRNEEES